MHHIVFLVYIAIDGVRESCSPIHVRVAGFAVLWHRAFFRIFPLPFLFFLIMGPRVLGLINALYSCIFRALTHITSVLQSSWRT